MEKLITTARKMSNSLQTSTQIVFNVTNRILLQLVQTTINCPRNVDFKLSRKIACVRTV